MESTEVTCGKTMCHNPTCIDCYPKVKTCPDGFDYCRGSRCHDLSSCELAGDCLYKSSGEQFKEAQVKKAAIPFAKVEQLAFEFVKPEPTIQRSVDPEPGVCGTCKSRERNTSCGVCRSLPEYTETSKPVVRTFATGANRDVDTNKLDYEGFLSPLVIERFAEYMHKNRFLRDGSMRDSDNWQKGIPIPVYMKSMWRHFFAVWKGYRKGEKPIEDLCALMFNVQGMLHEMLKEQANA